MRRQGLGIVEPSDMGTGITCASMPPTGRDRRAYPCIICSCCLPVWCPVNADSVQQPLLHPMALQQVLPNERVVGHQRLRRRAGFGLESDQPS